MGKCLEDAGGSVCSLTNIYSFFGIHVRKIDVAQFTVVISIPCLKTRNHEQKNGRGCRPNRSAGGVQGDVGQMEGDDREGQEQPAFDGRDEGADAASGTRFDSGSTPCPLTQEQCGGSKANTLNLDPGFWPNLDPDPGLYKQF